MEFPVYGSYEHDVEQLRVPQWIIQLLLVPGAATAAARGKGSSGEVWMACKLIAVELVGITSCHDVCNAEESYR